MLSGRRLDILNPSPLDVEIEDIAHGLARVARWNGQTRGGVIFSVAQHSVLVAEILGLLDPAAPARWRLHALLHDAPEYVIGDMISPFKAALGEVYREVEERLARAILQRFSLNPDPPAALSAPDQEGGPDFRLFRGDALCRLRDATKRSACSAPRKSVRAISKTCSVR